MSDLYDYTKITGYTKVETAIKSYETKLSTNKTDTIVQATLRDLRFYRYKLVDTYLFNIDPAKRDINWVREALKPVGFTEAELNNLDSLKDKPNTINSDADVDKAIEKLTTATPPDTGPNPSTGSSTFDPAKPVEWVKAIPKGVKVTAQTFVNIRQTPRQVALALSTALKTASHDSEVLTQFLKDFDAAKTIDIPEVEKMIPYGFNMLTELCTFMKFAYSSGDFSISQSNKQNLGALFLRTTCYKMYISRLIERNLNPPYYRDTISQTNADRVVYTDSSYVIVDTKTGGTFGDSTENIAGKVYIAALYSSNMHLLFKHFTSPYDMYKKTGNAATFNDFITNIGKYGFYVSMWSLRPEGLMSVAHGDNTKKQLSLFENARVPADIQYPCIFTQPEIYRKLIDNDIDVNDYPSALRTVNQRIRVASL